VGYQFIHVDNFSSKTGGGVAAEGERVPENSRHVEDPKPPILLAGVMPTVAWVEVDRRRSLAKDPVRLKSGRVAMRQLRSDANIMVAAVASHPEPVATCDTESPEFQDWLKRTIAFLTEQHGEPLSVVMHLDEAQPHIHFLAAPDLENGERITDIHVGLKAMDGVGGRRAGKIEKKSAFNAAMRLYQDSYQEAVGIYHGQARLGPRKRRLPTGAYKAEQAEAARQAKALRELEQRELAALDERQTLDTEKIAVAGASAEIAQARADLVAREEAVKAAQTAVEAAKTDLEAREIAVEVGRVEVVQVKAELGERETAVKAAQADVSEAQGELEKRETAVGSAQRNVKKTKAELKGFRSRLETADENLTQRIEKVTEREERLGSFWGAFVSVVTLGRAGTKRRVGQAVEAVKADFKSELAETIAEAEKATKAHEKAIERLENENFGLVNQGMTLAGTVNAAEKATQQAQAKAAELAEKLGPMEATNAELKAARDNLAALVDDLDAAASAGDLATVQNLLNPDGVGPGLRL
jgi:predicted  nucleic acid-binding Zn-ribbon protein